MKNNKIRSGLKYFGIALLIIILILCILGFASIFLVKRNSTAMANPPTQTIDLPTILTEVSSSTILTSTATPYDQATLTPTPYPTQTFQASSGQQTLAYFPTPTQLFLTQIPTQTVVAGNAGDSDTSTPTPLIIDTPNATQTLLAAFNEVNDQFKNLPKSSIAFNKPEQIKKGETARIELILNPSLSESALATQLVDQSNLATSTANPNILIDPNGGIISIETGQIEITPRMKAVLLSQDPDAFIINQMHDNAEQVIDTLGTTTWRWSVTAKKEGSQTLELIVYRLIKYDGKEFWKEVETYEANIVVEVTAIDKFKGLDWKWIAGFTLALISSALGISNWISNKRKKAEEEGRKKKK